MGKTSSASNGKVCFDIEVASRSMPTRSSARKNAGSNSNDAVRDGRSKRLCCRETQENYGINNLTDDALTAIADYLPRTSRALFAVALTAPSSAWRGKAGDGRPVPVSRASRAIISSTKCSDPFRVLARELSKDNKNDNGCQAKLKHGRVFKKELKLQIGKYYSAANWGILDFVDIVKGLAAKITDDDLYAILVCINARNNLKQLNLTHCTNIVGHGLEPLQGSVILEHLDLSLVRQCEDTRSLKKNVLISQQVVTPMLDNVLSTEGNQFQRLQLPLKWRCGDYLCGEMYQLWRKYNGVDNRALQCLFFTGSKTDFLKSYLHGREHNTEERIAAADACGCGRSLFIHCTDCSTIFCKSCQNDCIKCDYCDTYSCTDCFNSGEQSVVGCDCGTHVCFDCTVADRLGHCDTCDSMAFDRLLPEYHAKVTEIERLRLENEELRERLRP